MEEIGNNLTKQDGYLIWDSERECIASCFIYDSELEAEDVAYDYNHRLQDVDENGEYIEPLPNRYKVLKITIEHGTIQN